MRDGRNSIAPVASFDLRVGVDEWRAIESEMEQFRRAGEWLIRSDVRTDESFRWLQISMCRQSGTNIFVQGLPDQSEVSFFIFQPQGGSSWEQDFQTLYKRISGRWPTKIVFEDHQGRESSPPDWVDAKAGIGEATPSGNRNP